MRWCIITYTHKLAAAVCSGENLWIDRDRQTDRQKDTDRLGKITERNGCLATPANSTDTNCVQQQTQNTFD